MALKVAAGHNCPDCGVPLAHVNSNEGTVGPRDEHRTQYDYHDCPKCKGHFQYSHEDQQLRRCP